MSIKAESLFPDQPFEIVYGSTTLFEKPVDMQDRLAFHVIFSSTHKQLLMVRARDFNQGLRKGREVCNGLRFRVGVAVVVMEKVVEWVVPTT